MTKRTLKRLLLKYKLEGDIEPLYKRGLRTAHIFWCADKSFVTDLKLKGTFPNYKRTRHRIKVTWAKYCFMYKQETGKDTLSVWILSLYHGYSFSWLSYCCCTMDGNMHRRTQRPSTRSKRAVLKCVIFNRVSVQFQDM